MVNSSATRRTEICRSRMATFSIARMLSLVSAVVGQALRDISSKAHVESLNSATHFATVRYDGADSP